MPELAALPGPLRAEIEALRETPAGQLVLRLYAQDRRTA
jgi:hypothetical protein